MPGRSAGVSLTERASALAEIDGAAGLDAMLNGKSVIGRHCHVVLAAHALALGPIALTGGKALQWF
jgi:hypothetical protein